MNDKGRTKIKAQDRRAQMKSKLDIVLWGEGEWVVVVFKDNVCNPFHFSRILFSTVSLCMFLPLVSYSYSVSTVTLKADAT